MALLSRRGLLKVVCVLVLLSLCFLMFQYRQEETINEIPSTSQLWLPSSVPPPSAPCSCAEGSVFLKDSLPANERKEVIRRRAEEFNKYKARMETVLSKLLFAPSNSPLQYPIQGFTVQPLTSTVIPGLALNAGWRSSYKVCLTVSKGTLSIESPTTGVKVQGNGESRLILESSSEVDINDLLSEVSYKSTSYHIHTGDLAFFLFEDHQAVFPIVIQQPRIPVLYDMGKDINSQVTITVKTFLRYRQLETLLTSIRRFYSNITVIIADDSLKPQKLDGENIQHYIMPPAQGWFAGRNLAVSQVTTKYFLWVDDDFVFTEETQIEKLVEVLEAVPDLDVVAGTVKGGNYDFSVRYEEGDEEGGCLYRWRGRFHSLPGFPQCSLTSVVINFFLARTDAVRRVGFDPRLKRVAHSEFFIDGLGSLLVASCDHVSVGHKQYSEDATYKQYRRPPESEKTFKMQLQFFKNNLKCIKTIR